MTIQEAVKSGKPFKRPGWDMWYRIFNREEGFEQVIDITYSSRMYLSPEDKTAIDWKTKKG